LFIVVVVAVVVAAVVVVVDCSRILLCMLHRTTFVLIPGCHRGVALCPLSK